MKMQFTFIAFIVCLFSVSSISGQKKVFLDKNELDDFVIQQLEEHQKPFDWNAYSDSIAFSAAVASDSLISIGFKPDIPNWTLNDLHKSAFDTDEWNVQRSKILNIIREHYGENYSEAYIFPWGSERKRPNVFCRIDDYSLIAKLKALDCIRYIEPLSYQIGRDNYKSTSGCSPVNTPIDATDTTATTPASVISWHNINHNIINAWPKCNKGSGVNLAIIDTGISPTQSKLNGDFDEGESAGRTVSKYGFFAPTPGGAYDGWEDQCGHGTSMSGLATAPKGFDNTVCGAAYQANLISYRATEDVVINTASEKDGVAESLYHAADTTVHIVSISLGDISYSYTVADAVIYAEGKGVLIFAAAGTSTYWTSGYGVIFPAYMNETIAVTGIKEGNAPFTRCDACHDGPEVDFVVEMEKTSNASRHGVTLGEPDLEISYVGGSSCATATTAGHAALIWSDDLSMNKSQILDRMMRAAHYFPTRDADHGWGTIDLCEAVELELFEVCDDSLSYEVTMEITNISFPSTSDGLFNSTAEWVIEIAGSSFFFEVDVNGQSGSPAEFLNNSTCGYYPMIIDIGNNMCGQNFLTVDVTTFEDDGLFSDCGYDSGDDDFTMTNETISFSGNSFTHSSSAGNFVFTYSLYCTPKDIPTASITGDITVCHGASATPITIQASGSITPYMLHYNVNGSNASSITTDNNGNVTINHDPIAGGSFVYYFTELEDANGCITLLSDTITINVVPPNYQTGSYGPLTGIEAGVADYETDGILDSYQIIESTGYVDYDSGTEINLLPGFEVKMGAVFYGFIDGCNNGAGGLNVGEEIGEADKK